MSAGGDASAGRPVSPLTDDTFKHDVLTHRSANALEEAGFIVNDRQANVDIEKVLGYVPRRSPAEFALPDRKIGLLYISLREVSQHSVQDIDILRSILVVWIWGAVLRGELLAFPFTIFAFRGSLSEGGASLVAGSSSRGASDGLALGVHVRSALGSL